MPAAGAELRVLVDLDNNAGTGCAVATPSGTFSGAEQRIITTVDTTVLPPRVTQVTQELCTDPATNTFGAPVVISSGGWNVGVGNGTAGDNVIESSFPVPPGIRLVRLGFIYSDPAIGSDGLITQASGAPIIVLNSALLLGANDIPALSPPMLALLAALIAGVAFVALRRARVPLGPLVVVMLILFSSLTWAAIVLDGLTPDWATIGPIATDAQGDSPPGSDISAAFAVIEGNTLFVRVDVKTGLPPLAAADSYSVLATSTLNVPAATGLLANDSRGIPAATVTSYGGGSLGGAVTDHANGTTTAFGTGGSLIVNAGGSFTFTPASGFTGNFTFNYRITNLNGTSDATVTISAQQAPAITSANATTFNVGTAGTFTVTATGAPTPTLAVSGALPSGVTFNAATGALSGTPGVGTAGTYPLTFTASNGVGANATQSFTLTVTQGPAITSANATTFTVGAAGTFAITTSGTPVAATITVTGALPTGVTFTNNGNGTATLAGTPAAATGGTYPLTITANNGTGTNGTQSFTLSVNQAPAITSANATTFTTSSAGTFSVTSTGFPNATLSVTGALPSGVTFTNNGNGTATLGGTPATGTGGSYPLTFTAANGVGANATQSFTLTVNAGAAFTSANATTFTVGSAGTFTVTTTGPPTAATITATGALPAGVTFTNNGNGTATLAGTPGAGTGGSYPIVITANNGVASSTQNFTLTVNQAPAITSANNTTFVTGNAGTFTVTATGFPVATLSLVGALPSGVTFNTGTGVLSGTPAGGTAGTYPLTFTAANGVGANATQSFTLTVNAAPVFTSANSTTFTVGTAGTFTVTATGTPAPTLSLTGALPAGVTFTPATGVLSGTPGAGTGGTYPLSFTASNGVGSNATQNFTLTVNQAAAITSANNATFVTGNAGTFTVTATGFPTPTFSVTGALPSGVTLNPSTGVLSGTPAGGTAGTYPLTFTAANGVGANATQSFTLTVNAAPVFTSASSTTFTVGAAGTFTVTATGTPAPTLSLTGALPTGVTFTPATGVLAGTPGAGTGGIYALTFTAANGVGSNATQNFTLTVNQAPAITSANATTFTVGSAGTFSVTASGFPAPALSVAGALPSGVTFTPATGVLSGTPASGTAGSYALTFTAANGVGANATQGFTLTVNAAPVITSANGTTFTVGGAGTFTVTATGTPAPTLSVTGALPAGVTFTPATGVLAGTPGGGTGGIYALTFTAANGVGANATQSFTLTVAQAPAITSANAVTFTTGNLGTFTVTASGFPAAGLSSTGALPSGVTFTNNGNGTATLAGTPAAGTGGSYPLLFTASNGVGSNATQNFTLTVQDGPIAVADAYSMVHDTVLTVIAPGVLANDTGVPAPTMASVTGSGAPCVAFPCTVATASGSVTVAADGSFTYTPAADFAGVDSFSYTISNVAGTGGAVATITVTDAAPIVDLNGPAAGIDFGPVTFTEGLGAVAIVDAAQLTVADTDSANLASASAVITNLLDGAAEALSVTCLVGPPGCSGAILAADVVYTPATGTLTITRRAPLADYQALLRTLAYSNASLNPTTTARDISVTVVDASTVANSPLAHASVSVIAVNNAPTITAPATATTPTNTAKVFSGTISVADVDAGSAPVVVTLTSTNGTATLSGTAGLVVTGNGTALVTSTGPIASQNAALNGVSFAPTAAFSGAASLKIDVNDQGNTGTGGPLTATKTVAITVDNPPTVTSTVPVNGATSVALNATVTVNFSEAVTVTGSAFTLECPVGTPRTFSVSPASPASAFTLTPSAPLPASATCTLTVVANQVTDSIGQNMAANFSASFTTDTLPTVTTTVPVAGATGVQPASTITVNFSEPVNATTGSFALECPIATTKTFALSASPASSFVLTPSANLPTGVTCRVTVVAAQVTDVDAGQNMTANFVFSFTVAQPPAITSANAASFKVGTAGTFTVTTTGSPTNASMAISETGTLPAGVTLVNNNDGTATLAGTPAAATGGTYPITITADNGVAPAATQNFTLTVNQAPAITSAATSTLTVGTAGSFSVTTTGFPTNASMVITRTGALPGGVTFTNNNDGTATLAGTPAAGQGGSYPITITANNGVTPNATQSFTLLVNEAPAITSANASTFVVGTAGSFSVTTSGFPKPSIAIGGAALPAGVTFTDNGNGTGTLSGTPAAATGGAYAITFTATNVVGSTPAQAFTLTVNQAPAITSSNNVTFQTGVAGTFTVTATGFPSPAIARGGVALPPGVTFVNNGNGTGTLAGTPNAGTGGTYAITFTATNVVGSTPAQTFTLTVNQPPVAVADGPYVIDANGTLTRITTDPDDLLDNDSRGFPVAAIASFGGGSMGGLVTANAAGATVTPLPTFASGSLTVQSTGAFTFVPPTGFTGAYTFQYQLTNVAGSSVATVTINVRPKAVNDTLAENVVGNVSVDTSTGTTLSILTNDVYNGTPTINTSGTSTQGGNVTVAAGGTFIYDPPAGYEGADSFTYTITDSSGLTSTSATVSITVSGMIWFVNNNAAGCVVAGCGRLSNPFSTLAAFNALNNGTGNNPNNNDNIFVYESATAYTGAVTLRTGQKLIGQDATAALAAIIGLSLPSGAPALPAMNSANGTITTLASTVTLGASSTVQGLTISTGASTGLSGGAVSGVSVSEVNVATTTGTAVSLNGTGGAITLKSVSSNGAANGISLTSTTGSFTVTGVGTTVGSGGTIQGCSAKGADIRSSSNVTLKNMNFTGNATGNLAVATTCGDALNGTNGPTNCNANISLSNVNTATLDNVHVTGSKQIGVDVNGGSNLSLTNMTVTGNGDEVGEDGVQIVNLLGTLTISGGTYKDNAANQFEVQNSVAGTLTINADGATFSNTAYPTSLTTPSNSTANGGLFLATHGASGAIINPTVTNSTFDRIYTQAFRADMAGSTGMTIHFGPAGGAGSGNTVTNAGGGAIITGTNTGTVTYTIRNSNFQNNPAVQPDQNSGGVISARKASPASGTWTGTIENNTIGTNGVAKSGCVIAGCNAITADTGNASGNYTTTIDFNQVFRTSGAGIDVQGGGSTDTSVIRTTIQNNTLGDPEPNGFGAGGQTQGNAIFVEAGTATGDTTTVKAQIDNNTASGQWSTAFNLSAIRVRQRFATTTFCLTNYNPATNYGGGAGTNTSVSAFLTSANPASTAPVGNTVATATQTGGTVTGPSCP